MYIVVVLVAIVSALVAWYGFGEVVTIEIHEGQGLDDFAFDEKPGLSRLNVLNPEEFGAIERTETNRKEEFVALRNSQVLRRILILANSTRGPRTVLITKEYTIFPVRIGVDCLYSETFTKHRNYTCQRTKEIGLVNVTIILDGVLHAFRDPLSRYWDKVINDDQDKHKHANNDRAVLMFYQCVNFTLTSNVKRSDSWPALEYRYIWRPYSIISVITLGLLQYVFPIWKYDEKAGLIDGHGWFFWVTAIFGKGQDYRPHLISLQGTGIRIENIWFRNSPQWTIRMFDTTHSSVNNIRIDQNPYPSEEFYLSEAPSIFYFFIFLFNVPCFFLNTDGVDPMGQNISITNMWYYGGDDAVAVKPGTKYESNDRFGFDTGCTRDIFVENITTHFSVGLSIGSIWPTEDHTCIENVYFGNSVLYHPFKGVYIKANPDKADTPSSGHAANITYENIRILHCMQYPVYIGPQQQKQPGTEGLGCTHDLEDCFSSTQIQIRDITLKNVSLEDSFVMPGVIVGNKELQTESLHGAALKGIRFVNVTSTLHALHPLTSLVAGGSHNWKTSFCENCVAHFTNLCPESFECTNVPFESKTMPEI